MAIIKIEIGVELADGSIITVKPTPAAQVAFEREHGPIGEAMGGSVNLTSLYWLVWWTLEKGRQGARSFDDWLASGEIVGVGDVEDGDVADPTVPEGQPSGMLSPPQSNQVPG